MREIKFRAWDNNAMKYDVVVGNVSGTPCLIYVSWGTVTPNYPEFEGFNKNAILMQYTGLKDKNGKEIYEGDVISVQHYHMLNDGKKTTAEVRYKECSFYPHWLDKKCGYNDSGRVHFPQCEVIGDIYSNPELLNPSEK